MIQHTSRSFMTSVAHHYDYPLQSKYVKHTKISGSGTLIPYSRLQKSFFLYNLIKKRILYSSILLDQVSTNTIIIKFR